MKRVLDGATLLLALVAVVISVPVLKDRVTEFLGDRDRKVADWERLAEEGHRIGPEDPVVTIVEWGDYQCPACRSLHPRIERVLARFPESVALVYRHWPLSYHEHAYVGAVAAACAAEQDHFGPMHRAMLEDDAWTVDPPASIIAVAESVSVPDLPAFEDCVISEKVEDVVKRDIAAVEALGGSGTPTVVINGVLLGSVPDSAALNGRVESILEEAGSR